MSVEYPRYIFRHERHVDEQWGRRWITIDTSRVALAQPVRGNIRHGFVYKRVPHITLKSIANNAEIDVIWDQWQAVLEPLREEVPRDADAKWPDAAKKLHADWWQARIARQNRNR